MALKNVLAFVAVRDLEEGIRWYKMGVENVQKLKLNTAMLRPLSSVAPKPANVCCPFAHTGNLPRGPHFTNLVLCELFLISIVVGSIIVRR